MHKQAEPGKGHKPGRVSISGNELLTFYLPKSHTQKALPTRLNHEAEVNATGATMQPTHGV